MCKNLYIYIFIVLTSCDHSCNSFVNGQTHYDGKSQTYRRKTELLLTMENLFDWEKISEGESLPFFNFNSTCGKAIMKIKKEGLTTQYVDAMGKPGSGILEGNLFWIGNYRECMNIKNAQYCTMFDIKLQGEPVVVGTCVPEACHGKEVENLFKELANVTDTLAGSKVLDVTRNSFVKFYGKNASFCSANKGFHFNKSLGETITLTLCMIIALLCLIGTVSDSILSIYETWKHSNDNGSEIANVSGAVIAATSRNSGSSNGNLTLHPVVMQVTGQPLLNFFTCFSLIRNTKELLRTETSSTAISSIPGIRVLSLLWVMIGHLLIYAPQYSPIGNFLVLQGPWMKRFTMQALLNSALAVDTFFVLGGALVSYHGLRRYESVGYLNILRFISHRIFRIMPVYLFLLLFYTFVFPQLSSGPYWFAHGPGSVEVSHCMSYWWTNVIYVNDFYPPVQKGCFKWSWYLAVDMQYYMLSIVFIWCMWKSAKYGVYALNSIAIFVCMVVNGCLIYSFKATPIFNVNTTFNDFFNGSDSQLSNYMNFIYTKPYTRFTPYSVGLVLGYFLFDNRRYKGNFPMLFHGVGWLIAVCLAMLIVYVPYDMNDNKWGLWHNITYGVFFRFGWALSMAWFIYACHVDYGGLVNEFLSWKGFIPISRLTYSAYLAHVMVLFYYFGSLETPLYIDDLTLSFLYSGVVVITFMIAYIIGVCVEYPVFNLERLFFRNTRLLL